MIITSIPRFFSIVVIATTVILITLIARHLFSLLTHLSLLSYIFSNNVIYSY